MLNEAHSKFTRYNDHSINVIFDRLYSVCFPDSPKILLFSILSLMSFLSFAVSGALLCHYDISKYTRSSETPNAVPIASNVALKKLRTPSKGKLLYTNDIRFRRKKISLRMMKTASCNVLTLTTWSR